MKTKILIKQLIKNIQDGASFLKNSPTGQEKLNNKVNIETKILEEAFYTKLKNHLFDNLEKIKPETFDIDEKFDDFDDPEDLFKEVDIKETIFKPSILTRQKINIDTILNNVVKKFEKNYEHFVNVEFHKKPKYRVFNLSIEFTLFFNNQQVLNYLKHRQPVFEVMEIKKDILNTKKTKTSIL